MRNHLDLVGAVLAFLPATAVPAVAQLCEPEWSRFPVAAGINGEVRAVTMFDGGNGPRMYAAGFFSEVGGEPASGVASWEDGRWVEVGGGIAPVSGPEYGAGAYWMGVLDDGNGPALYVSGNFMTAGSVAANNVARWDGETWSAMGAGFNSWVRELIVFDHGEGPSIYAVGSFTASSASEVHGIARWTGGAWVGVDGGLSVNPQPGGGFGTGLSLAVHDRGDGPGLYVGGRFDKAGDVPAGNIARWDGSQWSAVGGGFIGSGAVYALRVFDDGSGARLHAGGAMALTPGATARTRVARLTGETWQQVGSDLSDQPMRYVTTFAVLEEAGGPTLYAGGTFAGASWLNQVNYIGRLVNGEWATVGGGMSGNEFGSPLGNYVRRLCVLEGPDGPALYASGSFRVAGDALADRIARWDGERWHGLAHGLGLTSQGISPMVTGGLAACTFDDGHGPRVFVGGRFRGAGDRVCNSIAAWDGAAWHTLGHGLDAGVGEGEIHALLPFDDGSGPALYATGRFTEAGGGPAFSIARWDGAYWSPPGGNGIWRDHGSGLSPGDGHALAAFDDGGGPVLCVGGRFDFAGDQPAGGVARWDGSAWSAIGTGEGVPHSYTIQALAAFDDGSGPCLYAGGGFQQIDGIKAGSIARWNGEHWSAVGSGFPSFWWSSSIVNDLAVVDHGERESLIAAGRLGAPAGTGTPLLAEWRAGEWQALSGSAGLVPLGGVISSVWTFDDGLGPALYVGGRLTVSAHNPPFGLLMLRDGVWQLPGHGVLLGTIPQNTAVLAGAIRNDGEQDIMTITGLFDHAGVEPSGAVAEWRGCPRCYGDCNRDSRLSIADFGCFQSAFAGSDPYADCDQSGAHTIADFACFQARFAAGCP